VEEGKDKMGREKGGEWKMCGGKGRGRVGRERVPQGKVGRDIVQF